MASCNWRESWAWRTGTEPPCHPKGDPRLDQQDRATADASLYPAGPQASARMV
jgi:hypothetical protein